MSAAERRPLLVARRISKSFGSTRALDGVTIEISPGEIHGLLGENGSGKSTLIRILAGYHAPDPGAELELAGRRLALPIRPGEPWRLGMRFVHQDLGLIPSLSVLENLRLDAIAVARGGRISWSDERRRARASLAELGVELDLDATVAELRPAEQALLAIARAAAGDAVRLLVLDEATGFLPEPEVERLFALVRRLAAAGTSVLFVSHELEEVRRLAGRVTVLRDGTVAATAAVGELDRDGLAELVAGRQPGRAARRGAPHGGSVVASIEGLSGGAVHELSLDLRKGEVVGLTGPVGSGFDEVPELLFGTRRCRSGRVSLGTTTSALTSMTPVRACRLGVVLLASRDDAGGAGSLSVADNVTLPTLDRYVSAWGLDRGRMLQETAERLVELEVRPPDPRLAYGVLSGGNQRKALLARALNAGPRLLLLEEPLRGVDVGARRQIVASIREVALSGCGVVCASSDRDELLELCDRVLAFSDGVVVATQTRATGP